MNSVKKRREYFRTLIRKEGNSKMSFPIDNSNMGLVPLIIRFKEPFQNDTINVRFFTGYDMCNYSCEYCIAGQSDKTRLNPNFNATRYLEIIKVLAALPFAMNIRIGVVGEYFISQDLIKGGRILSNSENVKHLNLITNLSFDYQKYTECLAGYDHQKLAIVASYHPTQIKNKSTWIRTAQQMNQKFDFAVVLVAFPPLLKELPDLVNELKQEGIEVFVQGYIGQYGDKQYPDLYTSEEKSLLKKIMYSRHDYEFFINSKRPGLCNAGFKSLYVNEEGGVYSCGMGKGVKLGNLLESREIHFFDGPRPCIHASCLCDTENVNTLVFEHHYKIKGINQHKYSYKFKNLSEHTRELDEWEIVY